MKKIVIAGLSLLVAGTMLTGCMKMEDSIVVNSDGSCALSGEISIEKDTVVKTYSDITGTGGGPIVEGLITSTLQQQGFTLVTVDGKEYYKISSDAIRGAVPEAGDGKCDSILDFYKYLSKNLGGILQQNENNVVSLSETSAVLKMPANESAIKDALNNTGNIANAANIPGAADSSTANAILDNIDSEKILESLKGATVTYNITFPTKIKEVSSNATVSEDEKTVSMTFPVITDKAYEEYAYCENDIPIEGVLNGITYNSAVTVLIPEGITATLNGSPVTGNSVQCDKTGTYNFKLSDGNTTTETLCFMVDKTGPVFARQKNSDKMEFSDFYSNNKALLGNGYIAVYDAEGSIKDIKVDGTSVLSGVAAMNVNENTDKSSMASSYIVYSLDTKNLKEGSHSISATDALGNESTGEFIIDNTKPTVKGVKNGKTYKKAVKITVSDKYGIKSVKLNGKTVKTGTKVSKNGSYTLKVTDNAGNVQTVKFKVKK